MNIEKVYQELIEKIPSSKVLRNESMAKHTSFKIGGNADIFVKATSIDDIKVILEISNKNNIPLYIIGNGSNVLVKDNGIRGIVLNILIDDCKINKKENKVEVTVGAGVKLAKLAGDLLKEEITGFEFASGIPGTIGGAVRMNAGAHGKEMKDIIRNTTYMDYDGNINTISNKEHEFSYRTSIFAEKKWIILETTLELEYGKKEDIYSTMKKYARYRKEKQPTAYPNAGSTFKRGKDFITAKLIDEAGLKECSIGGAEVSCLHAGFIINKQNATARDVLELIKYVKETVYNKFGKEIELEIEIIGE